MAFLQNFCINDVIISFGLFTYIRVLFRMGYSRGIVVAAGHTTYSISSCPLNVFGLRLVKQCNYYLWVTCTVIISSFC